MILRILIACLACVTGLSITSPADAAFPGPNGTIAFTGLTTVCGSGPCPRQEVMKTGPAGGPAIVLAQGLHPTWSPDGQRLAFVNGTDIYTVRADGANQQLVLHWNLNVAGIAWAPSGDRLAAALEVCDQAECRTDIHVIDLGPTGAAESVVDITPDLFADRNPAWSPNGGRIAFDSSHNGNNDVFAIDPGGSNLQTLTTDPASDVDPNWAPSGDALAFTSMRDGAEAVYTMDPNGAAQTRRTGLGAGLSREPAWSPDGRLIVFTRVRQDGTWLYAIAADGSSESQVTNASGRSDFEPDWQPASLAYPRPRGASPIRVSLVPSFVKCSAPNRAHGPPLGFGSCNLPSLTSPNITVGTPDVDGAAANSVGSVRLTVFPPPLFPDDADFGIEMSFSDIRCGSGTTACGPANDRAGADYTGELRIELAVRLTDKVAYEPTTTQDFTFPIRVGCSGSSSTATGAICSADTSANAVLPGSVHDGRRTIWQLGEIRVLDGGPDGDADTTADNRLFATQGVFVP